MKLEVKGLGLDDRVYSALGLMSGTSLDGVDAAIIRTDGERIFGFGAVIEQSYSPPDRATLAQATQAALRWNFDGPPPNSLLAAEHVIHLSHSNIIETFSSEGASATGFDVIGFHGQTVLHRPPSKSKTGKTLQLGAGQVLADHFSVPCVYDFRSRDVAAGGQGAPLAPIYHKALCDYSILPGNTVVLNLGGVGNFTWVSPGSLMASDTGPANGPLDSWLNAHDHDFDPDGQFSASGTIHFDLVEKWQSAPFFQKALPKSADRYDFDVLSDLEGMALEDGAATLAAYCALSVKATLRLLPSKPDQIIVCGGGRKNKTILNMMRAEFPCPVKSAEDVGWRGDFIEAEAFAYLAVRALKGLPISFPETTGVPRPLTGGVIVYPKS